MKLFFSCILFLPLIIFSQEEEKKPVNYTNTSVVEVLQEFQNLFDVKFSYQDSVLDDIKITLELESNSLIEALNKIKSITNLDFEIVSDRYIIVIKNKTTLGVLQKLDDIVLTGYLTKGIKKSKNATFTIQPSKLGLLPGLTEPDILESIQQLPGVISPNENATSFNVRGGASDQNRIIWDGINMYHKGHLFGMLSPFNPYIAKKITFYNKGTHTKYGERASSVVNIEQSNLIVEKPTIQIGINAINADAVVSFPLIKNKLSLSSSIRRSYSELYKSFTLKQLEEKVFQTTKVEEAESTNNQFDFLDYTLKLNYQLNTKNTIHASIINVENNLENYLNQSETQTNQVDKLNIQNQGYSLKWLSKWNKNLTQNTQAYFSEYQLSYNLITRDNDEQTNNFNKENVIFDSGLSTEFVFSKKNTTTLGYQYVYKDVNYVFINTSNVSIILDTDKNIISNHGLYGMYSLRDKKLSLDFGIRANYYQELDALRIEPRALLHIPIYKELSIQVSGEIKNQAIIEIDETIISDLSLENKLWRLSNGREYPIVNSNHISAGAIFKKRGWTFDIDGFYKKINNVSALSLGFLNPNDPQVHIGEQKIYGLDIYTKKAFNNLDLSLSYSIKDVKSKFNGINNENYFTANTSINHAVTSSMAYRLNNFEVTLGWKWRTGKPYTIATQGDNGLEFNKGINTANLDNYSRLDISSTYTFHFDKAKKIKGKMGISIRNLLDQENLISREYRGNNSLNDPIVLQDRYGIGFTPNLLFRVFW